MATGARRTNTTVDVVLTCQHRLSFKQGYEPATDDDAYCFRCGKERKVVIGQTSFGVRCLSCPMGRSYGQSSSNARKAAHTHVSRNASHRVEVRKGGDVLETITLDDLMPDRLGLRDIQKQQAAILHTIRDRKVANGVEVIPLETIIDAERAEFGF